MEESDCHFARVCIIGVGLIGGSMGLAIKHRGIADAVVGYEVNADAIRAAIECGAVDYFADTPAAAVENADLVIVSTPVDAFGETAAGIAGHLSPGTVVTDTGSTKTEPVRQMERVLGKGRYFVGGHPMTGSEKGGIAEADRYLFENAAYVVTPTERTESSALGKVVRLAEAVGARVVRLAPEEHDLIVAAVSHLPHLAAAALVLSLVETTKEHPDSPTLAAGGFRDTTRVAAGDPGLWKQICFSNREPVLEVLGAYRKHLRVVEGLLRDGDKEGFEALLNGAREQRLKIPAGLKGLLPSLHEIVVTVPDKPGVIGHLATLLGDAGVNIIDIEILRVREGEGGTIRLGFQSAEAAREATRLLQECGILVRSLKV